MVTKIMEWLSITALLLVASWRPVASYQIPLDLVVCWGTLVGVLAFFFIKHEIETHCDVDNRSIPRGESLQNCERGSREGPHTTGCRLLQSISNIDPDGFRLGLPRISLWENFYDDRFSGCFEQPPETALHA